jgi:hypothetical protein
MLKGVYVTASGGPLKTQVFVRRDEKDETLVATGFSKNQWKFEFPTALPVEKGDNPAVRVEVTNSAGYAQDVYVMIQGTLG